MLYFTLLITFGLLYFTSLYSVFRVGAAVGRWTWDSQVAGGFSSQPVRCPLSRNIAQLSLASLWGRKIEYLLPLGLTAGFSPLSGGR